MKVKALVSFVSTLDNVKHRIQAGQEFDLPKGADWLGAGLVELVEPEEKPAAKKPAKKKKSS